MQGKYQIYNYADDNTIGFPIRTLMFWKNILIGPSKQPFDGLNQITWKPIHQNFKCWLWKLVIAMSLLL